MLPALEPRRPLLEFPAERPFAVPELTRSADIKLNKRLPLRSRANRLRSLYRTLPQRPASRSWQSRQAIIFRLAALFCSSCKGQYALVFGFSRSSVARLLLSCGDSSDIWRTLPAPGFRTDLRSSSDLCPHPLVVGDARTPLGDIALVTLSSSRSKPL
jgi:hypothetical protein